MKVHRRSRSGSFSDRYFCFMVSAKLQILVDNGKLGFSCSQVGPQEQLISSLKFSSRTHPLQRRKLANTRVWVL